MEKKITITIEEKTWRKLKHLELDENIRTHEDAISKLIEEFSKKAKK